MVGSRMIIALTIEMPNTEEPKWFGIIITNLFLPVIRCWIF
jgi:hypothetical protein